MALQTHPDECRRRAVRRTVHEGDVAGPDAARVVNSQIALDDRCPPTPAEGFHRVHSVDTSKDMNSVVKSLLHNSLTPQPYQHAEGQIFLEPWQQSQPSDSTGQSSGPAVRPPVPLSILTAPKLQAPAYYLSPTQSSKKKSAEQSKTNQPRLLSFGHTVETQDGSQDGGTGRRKGFGRPTGNGSEAASAAAWRCDVCNQFNSGGAVTCSLCLCPRNAPAAASAATAATSSSSSVRPGAAAPPGRPAIPPPPPAASPPVVDDEVLFGSWNEQPDAVRDDPPLAGSWSTLPKAGAAGAGKNAATKAPAPATRDRMPSDDMDSDRIEYLRTATQRPTPTKGNPRIQRVDTTLLRGDATVAADDTFVPPASSTAAPPPNADWLWQWDSEQVCPLCVQPWKSLRIGMGRSALAAQQAHIKACAGMRR